MVHNNETDKEQRECPAEEITDRTDDTDNGMSWDYPEGRDNEDENISWDYSEERNDNKDDDGPNNNNRVTMPTNAVALHRKALPPLCQLLVISKFATQNTHGLRRQPCNAEGNP